MSKLVLTRGIPASGKTTWAKEWLAQDNYRARVNRDDLRMELYGTYWGPEVDEERVTTIQHSRVKGLLEAGFDVVVDDTNLRAKTVKGWRALAVKVEATVEHVDFPIDVEEAIKRDWGRGVEGGRSVGEEVIRDFYTRYTPKGKFPEFPVLAAEVVAQFEPYTEAYGLPRAILVDIDGTLAHMDGRSPYDPTLYHTDLFDEVVARLASVYAAHMDAKVIIMSGRDTTYRNETALWLNDNGFVWDEMYMRPVNDQRNDAIVKNELFEQHIAGKFNVDFILDDRDRVVNMWRAKGLKVLQVAAGNF